jgi:hypothetical protein
MALAHEVMHVLLAHEVFGMTLVKALNPVNRLRPLESLYEDFGSDLSMVMNLSPILKEQEHEADEGGLMLGWPGTSCWGTSAAAAPQPWGAGGGTGDADAANGLAAGVAGPGSAGPAG